MANERVDLAIDMLFPGTVKMELLQRIGIISNASHAAGSMINLYRVTIVDDVVERNNLVIQFLEGTDLFLARSNMDK